MLTALLFSGLASAASPQLALSFGGAAGTGVDWGLDPVEGVSYTTYGPMGAASVNWHLGALETWAGVSMTGLIASWDGYTYPASLFNGEWGIGFGAEQFGVGAYVGAGYPGSSFGLYTHLLLSEGKESNVGLEGRFWGSETGVVAGAVMLRIEPQPEPVAPPPRYRRPPKPYHHPY